MFCGRSGVRGVGFQVSGLSGAWRLCLKSNRTMEGPCGAYKLMRPTSEIRLQRSRQEKEEEEEEEMRGIKKAATGS